MSKSSTKCNNWSRMGPALVVTDRGVGMWSHIAQAAGEAVRATSFAAGVRLYSATETLG